MKSLSRALEDLPVPDEAARAAVLDRARQVIRPRDALARFDAVAGWLAAWQRTTRPDVNVPSVLVFVADHGVTARGVSAYPGAVTAAMYEALDEGVATASVMARTLGASLSVIDVGVGRPTGDIAVTDALDPGRAELCAEAGRRAVAGSKSDLIVLGEMGIGNTTAAAAVAAGLFGMRPEDWTGRGTGVDGDAFDAKLSAVAHASRRVEGSSPLEVLRRAGGAELVALAAAALEARRRSIPVMLDGFVVTAACAALEAACSGALDHCIAGHCSAEPGHRLLLEKLGLEPLLDLDLRLGEGSGALAALPLVKLAARCVTDVATFSDRGMSGRG